jgi:hypothetical protein
VNHTRVVAGKEEHNAGNVLRFRPFRKIGFIANRLKMASGRMGVTAIRKL